MPSFSKSLETALHRALEAANERNHEFATLEHLLLALMDDRDAASVMRACAVDADALKARIIASLRIWRNGAGSRGRTRDPLITNRAFGISSE